VKYLHDRLKLIDGYFDRVPHDVPERQLIGATLDLPSAEHVVVRSEAWPLVARSRLLSNLARCVSRESVLHRDGVVALLRAAAIECAVSASVPPPTPASYRELRSLAALCAEDAAVARANVHSVLAGIARVPHVDALDPEMLALVMHHWVGEWGFAAIDSALTALGMPTFENGSGGRDDWWLSELISGLLQTSVDLDPEGAYDSFRAALDRGVANDPGLSRASTIWRPQISRRGQGYEVRHVVIDGLIASVEPLSSKDEDLGRGIATELWDSAVEVYQRVALWTASRADSWGPSFLEQRISQVLRTGLDYGWEVEFKTLLERQGAHLSAQTARQFEEWVLQGPDLEGHPRGLTNDQLSEARDAWTRDWLAVAEENLTPEAMERLTGLRSRRGPASTSRWERGVRGGFVRQISPLAREELAGHDAHQLAEAIQTSLSADSFGLREDFVEVSREGLVAEIAGLVREHPEWLRDAHALTLEADTWAIFAGAVARALRDEKSVGITWPDVAGLLEVGLEAPAGSTEEAKSSLAEIARWLISDDAFQEHWRRGEAVLTRLAGLVASDPSTGTLWGDAATAALNTPSGVAAEACCRALVRIGTAFGQAAAWDSELKPAIRSLLGRSETNAAVALWTVPICKLDSDWGRQDLRPEVFPDSDELFRAAWSTYVRYARLSPQASEVLREEYERSIDIDWADDRQVVESQSQHLVVFIAWGEVGLESGGLADRWYRRLSADEAAAANHFAAGEAANSDLPLDMRERLFALARWRIRQGRSEEFAQYGRWATAPMARSKILGLLAEASRAQLSPIYGDEVLRFLSDSRPETLREAQQHLAVLTSLVSDLESWRRDWEPFILSILAATVSFEEVQQSSLDLADGLARRGFTGLLGLFEARNEDQSLGAP
jgi:hypothetical protein